MVSGQKTSQAAVWSLVLGILSNFCLWFLGSIPAIILGVIAIKNINRNPSGVTGKGMAIAGMITAGTGLFVGAAAFSILFIGVAAYKKGADRAKCVLQLATVQKMVTIHAKSKSLEEGDPLPVTFLVDDEYLPAMYTCPDGGSYTALGKVPDSGTAYLKCDHPDPTHPFAP